MNTTHAIYGKNRGWRKAVRSALAEDPASDPSMLERIELFKVMGEEMHPLFHAGSDGK